MMIPWAPAEIGAGATVGDGAPVVAGTAALAEPPKSTAVRTAAGTARKTRRRVDVWWRLVMAPTFGGATWQAVADGLAKR